VHEDLRGRREVVWGKSFMTLALLIKGAKSADEKWGQAGRQGEIRRWGILRIQICRGNRAG